MWPSPAYEGLYGKAAIGDSVIVELKHRPLTNGESGEGAADY